MFKIRGKFARLISKLMNFSRRIRVILSTSERALNVNAGVIFFRI